MKKLIALLVLLSFILTGLPISASAQASSAKVISYSGNVDIFKTDSVDAVGCAAGMKFKTGDRIKTGAEAYVEMAFDRKSDSIVRVEENSNVVLMLKGNDKIELIDGEILTRLQNMPKEAIFQVRTPAAVCGARGTGLGVSHNPRTEADAFENDSYVKGIGKDGKAMKEEFTIKEGFRRIVEKFKAPSKMMKLTDRNYDKWNSWKEDRRQRVSRKGRPRRRREGMFQESFERAMERKDEISEKADRGKIEEKVEESTPSCPSKRLD